MSQTKVPRKLKKQIPTGVYCYQGISYNNQTGIYHVRNCIFFDHIKAKHKPVDKQDEIDKEYPEEKIHWCKLLKIELDDQCKSCGIKRD